MIKIYTVKNIQKVYQQFHKNPKSVVMSLDNGNTWFSPSMDTGKWFSGIQQDKYNTIIFAFLK